MSIDLLMIMDKYNQYWIYEELIYSSFEFSSKDDITLIKYGIRIFLYVFLILISN